jgi:hypothetical protein
VALAAQGKAAEDVGLTRNGGTQGHGDRRHTSKGAQGPVAQPQAPVHQASIGWAHPAPSVAVAVGRPQSADDGDDPEGGVRERLVTDDRDATPGLGGFDQSSA